MTYMEIGYDSYLYLSISYYSITIMIEVYHDLDKDIEAWRNKPRTGLTVIASNSVYKLPIIASIALLF